MPAFFVHVFSVPYAVVREFLFTQEGTSIKKVGNIIETNRAGVAAMLDSGLVGFLGAARSFKAFS